MALTIRPYEEGDAHAVAELYNRHRDNPNPVAGGITGAELARELAERETATFLLAEDDRKLVGTFGLFHHTGRRSARAGELIADMFFVHPAHRGGMVTGRLFTEAVEWMMRSGCLVLRLTVNPANTVAFRLYRRVGCVSVGRAVPGEDGNVELHNYIPLVLRSVLADLGERATAALGSLSSFASVTEARDDELRSDVRSEDGVRVVDYCLSLGAFRLDASVDVDRGAVREARLTEPGGEVRALRIAQPPYRVRTASGNAPHRFTSGALTCEVDGEEGTVSVFADGHHGPVLVSTWPSCRADRPAGWREGEPRDLTLEPVPGGVRVTERHGDDTVTGTVTLDDTGLLQEFTHTGSAVGRVFHTVGLRQGTFTDATGRPHPIGLGVGVRDASEVVAASHPAADAGRLTWQGNGVRVSLPTHAGDRLIHSTLLERGLNSTAADVSSLRAEIGVLGEESESPGAEAARRLEVHAGSGGVVVWQEGAGKVLRSPYPRTRSYGYNPRWSAGMWVTRENPRHDRAAGLGWGVPPAGAWEEKHPLGLHHPDTGLGWEIGPADDGLRVDVRAPDTGRENVVWLTPHAPVRTAVVLESADRHWELSTSDVRQVWARRAAVRLSDGRWLHCVPATPSPHDELVLRATASGLLIGAVSAARESAWLFSVHDRSLTS
ncbi:GNAT family N-acetyltransferase [Streptomyces sp. TRM68416]|uniref:GNAT family N-acetyltransferase n=1 Tax=Streptomyces sp. TRM68416 TaxID=2758412 RepID=UPI001661B339|nr:GNAT family N-acetyltransferase [Streptomyces sp. TRM68416]MBD0838584.1 GNAT family N-acetyltransferase [Streptomyces sp. TRM68416]